MEKGVCPRFFAAVAFAALAMPAFAEADRGRELYETHCINCHTTGAHSREHRVAEDFRAVQAWVSRWNNNLALGWSEEEILDVTLYLNRRFYNFPCPPEACKVVSSAPALRILQ